MPNNTAPQALPKSGEFAPVSPGQAGARILTVDDNEALRYSLVRTLREAGYQVAEARTGSEALALATADTDLITLDVHLPDILGFEVCKRLKVNPATAHIPILQLSSTFTDAEARVQGLSSGADAYLAEPIEPAELIATVGALLRLKQAENIARQQAAAAEEAWQKLAQLNETLERKVAERTAELKAANDSLRDFSGRLLRAQDDERRRIARELHDGIGQTLVAIKLNNAALANPEADASAQAAKVHANELLVDEIIQNIRTISHLLHPPMLDGAGLAAALRWYVREFSARSGIEVDCDCQDSAQRLPPELETDLYRVVQECLGNVHRHSASETAAVRFYVADGKVHLEVSDHGHGIPGERLQELAAGGGGVGLRGMRERVARSGGELRIDSNSNGTTVAVTVPLAEAAAR